MKTELTLVSLLIFSSCTEVFATQSELTKQQLVETQLRTPVYFSGEPIKTYSVEDRLKHHKVPGLSIAVIDNNQIAWTQGYGTLSASDQTLVNSTTLFQAASIAKPLTAASIMVQHQKEKLDITQNIDRYLDTIEVNGDQIPNEPYVNFQNLLNHSSGLTPGGYQGYVKGEALPTDFQTFKGLEPANTSSTKREHKPNQHVNYSGAGYTLAEIAIENTFKKAFDDFMHDTLLAPLNMKNSGFNIDFPTMTPNKIALGHDFSGRTVDGGWRRHPEQAAAGLWSTPTDLAAFALEVSNAYRGEGQLLSKESATQLLAPVFPDRDLSNQFGGQPAMSFIVDGDRQDKAFLFNHGGANVGYRCLIVMYPNTGQGAVFMTNSDAGYGVGVEMIRAISSVYGWPHYKGKQYTKLSVESEKEKPLIGTYSFETGWTVEVVSLPNSADIALKFANGDIYPLIAVDKPYHYVYEDLGVEVSFNVKDTNIEIALYNQTGNMKKSD